MLPFICHGHRSLRIITCSRGLGRVGRQNPVGSRHPFSQAVSNLGFLGSNSRLRVSGRSKRPARRCSSYSPSYVLNFLRLRPSLHLLRGLYSHRGHGRRGRGQGSWSALCNILFPCCLDGARRQNPIRGRSLGVSIRPDDGVSGHDVGFCSCYWLGCGLGRNSFEASANKILEGRLICVIPSVWRRLPNWCCVWDIHLLTRFGFISALRAWIICRKG